jgi:hypothetical protein
MWSHEDALGGGVTPLGLFYLEIILAVCGSGGWIGCEVNLEVQVQ